MIDFEPIPKLVFDAEGAREYLGLKSVRSLENLVSGKRLTPLKICKETIISISPNNLTRIGQKVARDAGMKPWPKLYQAMRSSAENDHKLRGVAEATYSAWMGHSPTVSRKHYTAPTDQEFAAVAKMR